MLQNLFHRLTVQKFHAHEHFDFGIDRGRSLKEYSDNPLNVPQTDLLHPLLALVFILYLCLRDKQSTDVLRVMNHQLFSRSCACDGLEEGLSELGPLGAQETEVFSCKHPDYFTPTDDLENVSVDRVHLSLVHHVSQGHRQQLTDSSVLLQTVEHPHQIYSSSLHGFSARLATLIPLTYWNNDIVQLLLKGTSVQRFRLGD